MMEQKSIVNILVCWSAWSLMRNASRNKTNEKFKKFGYGRCLLFVVRLCYWHVTFNNLGQRTWNKQRQKETEITNALRRWSTRELVHAVMHSQQLLAAMVLCAPIHMDDACACDVWKTVCCIDAITRDACNDTPYNNNNDVPDVCSVWFYWIIHFILCFSVGFGVVNCKAHLILSRRVLLMVLRACEHVLRTDNISIYQLKPACVCV